MPPLDKSSGAWGFSGAQAADHFGVSSNRVVD